MADRTFTSELVEEFYNSCHTKADGRFCGVRAKGKGVSRVPMSEAARRSNAVLRGISSARKSKEYKQAKHAIGGSWARREHGQGGNVGTGRNSAKADRARAANAQGKNPANKDGSEKLVGGFKLTGHKGNDAIAISRLDRGSPARKAAARAFEEAYGNKKTPAPISKAQQAKVTKANDKKFGTNVQGIVSGKKAEHVGGTKKATPAVRKQFAAVHAAWAKNPTKETKDKVRAFLNKYDDL